MFNFIYKLKSSEICLKKKIKHKIVNTKSPFEISLFFTKVRLLKISCVQLTFLLYVYDLQLSSLFL